jgi:general secretion pathway protein H
LNKIRINNAGGKQDLFSPVAALAEEKQQKPSSSPYKRRIFSRGFTLLELVVVIAIISVIMMLAIPRLPSSNASDLRNSARTLAATLRYLGENSVTARIQYRMHLNVRDSEITIAKRTGDGGEAPPDDTFLNKRLLAEGITIGDVLTPRLGTVKEGEVLLDFGPGGMADFLTIHLRKSAGAQYTVIAFPGNGKIKVYEGYQEAEL